MDLTVHQFPQHQQQLGLSSGYLELGSLTVSFVLDDPLVQFLDLPLRVAVIAASVVRVVLVVVTVQNTRADASLGLLGR